MLNSVNLSVTVPKPVRGAIGFQSRFSGSLTHLASSAGGGPCLLFAATSGVQGTTIWCDGSRRQMRLLPSLSQAVPRRQSNGAERNTVSTFAASSTATGRHDSRLLRTLQGRCGSARHHPRSFLPGSKPVPRSGSPATSHGTPALHPPAMEHSVSGTPRCRGQISLCIGDHGCSEHRTVTALFQQSPGGAEHGGCVAAGGSQLVCGGGAGGESESGFVYATAPQAASLCYRRHQKQGSRWPRQQQPHGGGWGRAAAGL